MAKIRLMIADDDSIVREGVKCLLESEDEFQIIGTSNNGNHCLDMLSELKPDLLILDLRISDGSGFDILKMINEDEFRKTKILILTNDERNSRNYLLESYRIGIDGYLLKSAKVKELKKAIVSIMKRNECYIQSELKSFFFHLEDDCLTDMDRIKQLTIREIDVLKNLSVGMYNKEIAIKLNISERTVKNHISSIFKKIGVSDRTQAAVFSIRNNIIEI